jgi:hypothetical protein
MKCTICSVLVAAVVTAAGVGFVFAQDGKPKMPKDAHHQHAQPDVKKPEGKPEGMPDEAAMMEAWQKAMTPGEMHEYLAKGIGEWEGTMKWWMAPGTPPAESPTTTTISAMMGGRFTMAKSTGTVMGQPFEGMGIYGYNNSTKKFESVWMDNMGTMMMNFTGTMGADKKSITWETKFMDPMTGKESWMKNVETMKSDSEYMMEMYGPSPTDGKEFKSMEISYKRKAK